MNNMDRNFLKDKNNTSSMRINNVVFSYFITAFLLCYAMLTWLPQYTPETFKPAVFSMPLSKLSMDFDAVVVSAKRLHQGKSPRLLNLPAERDVYPYPIGGAIHSYGGLTIIAIYPFKNIAFQTLRHAWLLITIAIIVWLCHKILIETVLYNCNKKYRPLILLSFSCLILILSGPINLLIERGQIEIIIPFLLYFVWQDYRQDKVSFKTSLLLGLAIHIKEWPLLLLALFLSRKNFRYLIAAGLTPLVLSLLLNPILPIHEQIKSTELYAHAASQMTGWISVSLFSLLSVLKLQLRWKFVTAIWLVASALLLLYMQHKTRNSASVSRRDQLFAYTILVSLLAPGFMCDYCLVVLLLLLPMLGQLRLSIVSTSILAILQNNLLFFGYYAGGIKAALMLFLIGAITYELLNSNTQLSLNKS